MRRLPRPAVPALAAVTLVAVAVSACFDKKVPTEQIGGTQYDIPLNAPSATRYPSATFTVHRRGTTGTNALIIDSITVAFSTLKSLVAPARYQMYLVNGNDSTARPIGGTTRLSRLDSTLTATGVTTTRTVTANNAVTSFYGGAPFNTIDSVRIRNLAGTPDSIGSLSTFLVLTIQPDSTTPSFGATTPKPLWFRFRDIKNAASTTDDIITVTGSGVFGTFAEKGLSRPYTAQGNGYSAFWDRDRDATPELFSALAFNMTQPPIGYFYQPWMRDTATLAAVKFGELRDTLGHSLRDADMRPAGGVVVQLPPARFATRRDSVGAALTAFTHVQLVLEPKTGDLSAPNATVALQGALGDTLRERRQRGTLTVTAARGATPAPGATIYVLSPATGGVIASGLTDAAGQVSFQKVPAGPVDLLIFPPTGFTIANPRQTGVTVAAGRTTQASFALQ